MLNYNDLKPCKIYYLSSEFSPYAHTSNLSDLSKEFSTYLNDQKDIEIRLIQPKYGFISERKYVLREVIRLKELTINFKGIDYLINIKSAFIPNTRTQIYFLEYNDYYFDLSELLYKSKNGRYYKNNDEKYSFFVEVALQTLKKLFWTPDVIVFNDWQTSILPILLKEKRKEDSFFENIKTVFYIHNIDSNYNFSNELFKDTNLKYDSKKSYQDMIQLACKHADLIYVVDNDSNAKKIKSILKNKKYKIINPTDSLKSSEKLELFNKMNSDIQSII